MFSTLAQKARNPDSLQGRAEEGAGDAHVSLSAALMYITKLVPQPKKGGALCRR